MADFNYLILTEQGQSHSYAAQLVFSALAGFVKPSQIVPTRLYNPDKAAKIATTEPNYKLAVVIAEDPTKIDSKILDTTIPKIVLTPTLPSIDQGQTIEQIVLNHPELALTSMIGRPVDTIRNLIHKYYPTLFETSNSKYQK